MSETPTNLYKWHHPSAIIRHSILKTKTNEKFTLAKNWLDSLTQ